MSNFNQTDGEGNYSNKFGDRTDAESHGIFFNSDPIPGQHQSSQLVDGANTIPSGTSIEAVPSNILKVKIHKFDDECERYKNELASLEAENVLVKDQCARELKDLKRQRAIVDSLKKKSNEVTDKVTELCMKLIIRMKVAKSTCAQMRANIARLVNYEEQPTSADS